MKQLMNLMLVSLLTWTVSGCGRDRGARPARAHEDGVYRGVFIDGDSIQINVEFELRDGIVRRASFRHLRRDDQYHLEATEEPFRSVIRQYQEALDHLVGKPLERNLRDLYTPEQIVETQVDGYTAATLRSNKIISAIRDGLNRGVYSYP